jgi:hypothetical protein
MTVLSSSRIASGGEGEQERCEHDDYCTVASSPKASEGKARRMASWK